MKQLLILLIFLTLLIGCSSTQKKHERYYQRELCNSLGGVMEYRLRDKTRVDCLTGKYAIEVDFANKWAESIGQSLFYAKMTSKEPAVGLIIDKEKEQRYLKRLSFVASKYGIKLFIIEK